MHVCEHERELGGGRAAWWAWDSRNGSCCAWVCVYVVSYLRQVKPLRFVVPSFVFDVRDSGKIYEATGRRKVRWSTGVKWSLKFQWQSGRNPPELSPHMSCNLGDISRLLQPMRGFRDSHFLLVCVALKSIASLKLISCFTFKTSQQMWLCKHLLLTWKLYSPSVFFPYLFYCSFLAYLFNIQLTMKLISDSCRDLMFAPLMVESYLVLSFQRILTPLLYHANVHHTKTL